MFRKSDRILYVISARTELSWTSLRDLFDHFYVEDRVGHDIDFRELSGERRATFRALDALAHCDIDMHDGRAFVGPMVLARLPAAGLPSCALIGARSAQFVEFLLKLAKQCGTDVRASIQDQPRGLPLVPSRILVEAAYVEQLDGLAKQLKINFSTNPPSWALVHFAGSIESYMASLKWTPGSELGLDRKDFIPSSLRFSATPTTTPFRLSSYLDRVRTQHIHLLWRNNQWARVDRDWGRYCILRETAVNVLLYDDRTLKLAVPGSAPLPRLLARAAALCSGYAARFVSKDSVFFATPETWGFNIFSDVPEQIAVIIASKLGQELVPYPLGNA